MILKMAGEQAKRDAVALAVLLFLCILTFSNAWHTQFVWVDHAEIEQEGYLVSNWSDVRRVLMGSLESAMSGDVEGNNFALPGGGYYRPVYSLVISTEVSLFGKRPALLHGTNVIWHSIVVGLLYFLGKRLVDNWRIAMLGSAMFAVHPINAQSVAWISGQKDLLSSAFGLLGILLVLQVTRLDQTGRRVACSIGAMLAFLLSIGSKELGYVFPLAAAAILVWETRPRKTTSIESKRQQKVQPEAIWLTGVALIVPWIGMLAWRFALLGRVDLNASYPSTSVLHTFATHARLDLWYVVRILFPGAPIISDAWRISNTFSWEDAFCSFAMTLCLFAACVGYVRRTRWGLLLVLFVILISPALGFVPLRHLRAERYLFPGAWALLLTCLTLGVSALRRGFETLDRSHQDEATNTVRPISLAVIWVTMLAIAWCSYSGWRAWSSNSIWASDQALFTDATRRDPNYAEGWSALSYQSVLDERWTEAVRYGEEAVQLGADSNDLAAYWSPFVTRTNLGLAYLNSGAAAKAKEQFLMVSQISPDSSVARYHVGLAELELGNLERAIEHFEFRLTKVPEDDLALSNLAVATLMSGRAAKAEQMLLDLPSLQTDERNQLNLINAYLLQGKYDQAYPLLAQRFQREPENVVIVAKLGLCALRLNRIDQAERLLFQAEKIDRDAPESIELRRLVEAVDDQRP